MKLDLKKLLICLAIPLAVGGGATLLSGGMESYGQLEQPPLSPPGWVFPVAWTILYLLMGYASFLVLTSDQEPGRVRSALVAYGAQLAANFVWPLLFFGGGLYLTALLWLVVLWLLIFWTIREFQRCAPRAADLLIPYILWVTFAWYLNLGVFLLN